MSSDLTPADRKRDELRMKIEASERRIADRTLAEQAQEAAKAATDYARANPMKVVGGAVALGIVIGLLTSPGRRVAKTAATGAAGAVSTAATSTAHAVSSAASGAAGSARRAVSSRGSKFLGLIADALIAYGIKLIDEAMDGARAGKDKLEDIGDSTAAKARELRRDAGYMAGSAADKGRTITRRTRRRAERAVRDLTERARN